MTQAAAERKTHSMSQPRNIDRHHLPALGEIDGGGDAGRNRPQGRPVIGGQYNNRQFPISEVLLKPEILVARDQDLEPVALCRPQQISVCELFPAQFTGTENLVSPQESSYERRHANVEQDLHAAAAGSRDFLANSSTACTRVDVGEPFEKFVH
jgi:hypothetical protein